MVIDKEQPALRPAQERLLPLEALILDHYRGGDNFKTILGVLEREHGIKVASGTLRSFIRSRLELEEELPEEFGYESMGMELLAPLQDEVAGLREELAGIRDLIKQAGEELEQAARHIQEQRGASVYDYLQHKLRGVWIRALVITFVLWGLLIAGGWYGWSRIF